jgi:hypothetical protein
MNMSDYQIRIWKAVIIVRFESTTLSFTGSRDIKARRISGHLRL